MAMSFAKTGFSFCCRSAIFAQNSVKRLCSTTPASSKLISRLSSSDEVSSARLVASDHFATSTHNAATSSSVIAEHVISHDVVDPLKHPDFFGVRDLFTLDDLFNANVHIGHKRGLRHPHMRPFIVGSRLEVDIIDLTQTVQLLGDALNFLAHIAYRRGVILFISQHRQMTPVIEQMAHECGEYAHCRDFRGGTFTNSTIQFGTVIRLPDVCVFMSVDGRTTFMQHLAVTEAAKMNIPSISILDTAVDPRLITYPIPGNDDSPSAIALYCRLFSEAIRRGKVAYAQHAGSSGIEDGK